MGQQRNLQSEIEAAKLLRDQMADIAANDPEFMADIIEGETDIREIINRLVDDDGFDKSILEGIAQYNEKLQTRKMRVSKRIEVRRMLIAKGLEVAGIKSHETPTGTVSLRPVAPNAITTDESAIPSKFWKAGKPTLDKKALLAALKENEPVPGATLSNGSTTISIRR